MEVYIKFLNIIWIQMVMGLRCHCINMSVKFTVDM